MGQNGEYSESLIQYEMSQEEIAWLAAGEIIDLDDRLIIYTPLEGVNFSDILGRSAGCYTVEWSAPVGWCSNLGMSEQDAFNLGYSQSECGLVVVYTVTITDHCSESEGGDGGNGGLPGNGGNPYNPYDPWGGQGGGPNNGGPQGPITDPNPGGGGNSNTFGFTFTQWQWMNNNGAVKSQIIGYLSQGGDFSFATELLDLLIELNYTTPIFTTADYPGKNEGFPFNWWKNTHWMNNNFYLGLDENTQGPGIGDLTAEELILSATFPTAAITIWANVQPAFDMSVARVANNGNPYQGYNDKRDAFRHAYFNALNTRDVFAQMPIWGGPPILAREIVRLFGIAHESEVPANMIKEKIMDLHNNEVGIQYCTDCYPGFTTDNEIANAIMNFLNNGNLRYLHPLNSNNTINSNTQIIPTNQ